MGARGTPFGLGLGPPRRGYIGAAEVAKATRDGYTVLMGTPGTQSINQFLYSKMRYSTEKRIE
ncbi:MAG: hypothetical protein HY661_04990 [Betaproteobacteria bacterium]|nr:hypothetical protein [Betaproteobacteria bacterium]